MAKLHYIKETVKMSKESALLMTCTVMHLSEKVHNRTPWWCLYAFCYVVCDDVFKNIFELEWDF